MNRTLLLAVAFCAAGVAMPARAGSPLTLKEFYAAALRRSETVSIQSQLIDQAIEKNRQAVAAIKPNLRGFANYTWQQNPPGSASIFPNALGYQPEAGIQLTQPLFSGFREFAALRQAKDLVGAQRDDYRNACRLLFNDVVQNFYTILADEKDLANLQDQIHQNELRAKDLRARVRIGRSRESELLSVQSTIATLRAQVEQGRGQLHVARENFAFLSGMSADTPLEDSESLPKQVQALNNYLSATESRADVRAARARASAAHENVKLARGAYLPTLNLTGNYYLERPGYLNDINWSVQLNLSVPIYSGGALVSATREAVSQQAQAQLTLTQVTRQARQEIRSLHDSTAFDLKQIDALRTATEAAKKNYAAQLRDYHLGLVTNLDVLQSLTSYQENQRALDRARYAAKIDWLKLLVASGERKLPAAPESQP
jgi:outer membrane protein